MCRGLTIADFRPEDYQIAVLPVAQWFSHIDGRHPCCFKYSHYGIICANPYMGFGKLHHRSCEVLVNLEVLTLEDRPNSGFCSYDESILLTSKICDTLILLYRMQVHSEREHTRTHA